MRAWGLTSAGVVRKENQDFFETFMPEGVHMGAAVVCDGMGGAKAGEVASSLAVSAFVQEIVGRLRPNMKVDAVASLGKEAVNRANYTVFKKSLESQEYDGMGTTLVSAVMSGSNTVVINVGDSRAYLITPEGLTRLTVDHSVVEDMIQRGDITRERARRHPIKNLITRAVGTEKSIECDIFNVDVNYGEYILLCSDGLSNLVSDPEILFEVIHGGSPDTCCRRLMEIAIKRGAPDNVTVVLIER